uniref:Sucrose phosphatase-like domain-containing protein n=1 Tax=Amphora coffeiformis TaxID=265554 RepID=A0A7S3KXL4_9STRA
MNWPAADREKIYASQQSYQELFARCELLFEHVQGVFLKGTPGIGKSCFLDFVLHRYLNNGKKVLYVSGPRDWVYTFYPDGTFDKNYDVKKSLIEMELANDEDIDIVLFDPQEDSAVTLQFQKSHFHGKKFIVAMKPDPQNCKKLRKTSLTSKATLYLGTLSLPEAEAMRAACYPHVLADLLRTRYEVMGGIPRYLFGTFLPGGVDEAKNEVEQMQLRALNEAVEHPLQIDGGEVASDFEHLWSLYHIQPVSNAGVIDYHRYTIEICCDDARTKLRTKLMEKSVTALWRLYRDTAEQHGGLRGLRYEAYAHKKTLSEGLDGRAPCLTQRGTGKGSLSVNTPVALQKIVLPDNNVGPHFQAAINQATQSTDGRDCTVSQKCQHYTLQAMDKEPSTKRNFYIASMICRWSVFQLLCVLVTMSSSMAATATSSTSTSDKSFSNLDTKCVFSDVDGTLVHYPENLPDDDFIVALPPSATGMRAIISSGTLQKCHDIRKSGRKLVLVSGMRTSTLLTRIPYLPRADAYCSEAGGRIFYPTDDTSGFCVEPQPFKGATYDDLKPFGLTEDTEWRKTMEKPAGLDGFAGQELMNFAKGSQSNVPASLRQGLIWDYARELEGRGLVLDSKGYATAFRVTAKQQPETAMEVFRALQENKFPCPPEVTTRTNLGSMDFYPTISGKKNCCEYLAMKLTGASFAEHAVCMGDDDNDIEMALASRHAFIPTVTSDTMDEAISQHPGHFTAIRGVEDTMATEKALEALLKMLQEEEEATF